MATATGPVVMTIEEWRAEAVRRFGEDECRWKFVCPVCGHVQSIEDFHRFKARGASPSSAYQECIGRYTGVGEMKPRGEGPCNYAGYGLFRLSPVRVVADGEEHHAFAFAEVEAAAA